MGESDASDPAVDWQKKHKSSQCNACNVLAGAAEQEQMRARRTMQVFLFIFFQKHKAPVFSEAP